MTSSKSNPSVLLLGLPPDHHLVPEALRSRAAEGLVHTKYECWTAGVDYEDLLIPPEELAALEAKLKEKPWDALIVGNGVRSSMELTHFMEQALELKRQLAPQAIVLFNTLPQDNIVAIRRWFPNVKQPQ